MQEAEEKTTDVFYHFRKRDILKENGLRQLEPAAAPCTSPLPSGTKRWMPCLTRIWHKCYNILKFRPCQSGR